MDPLGAALIACGFMGTVILVFGVVLPALLVKKTH
jgi:hypothetical protein